MGSPVGAGVGDGSSGSVLLGSVVGTGVGVGCVPGTSVGALVGAGVFCTGGSVDPGASVGASVRGSVTDGQATRSCRQHHLFLGSDHPASQKAKPAAQSYGAFVGPPGLMGQPMLAVLQQ